MQFPKYWVCAESTELGPDGTRYPARCWGWSNESESHAKRDAESRARKVAAMFARGEIPERKYPYGDRPLREEVLEEFPGPGGNLSAVVTRNGYGCLVLNTSGAMFVDVDLPERKSDSGISSLLGSLFGGRKQPTSTPKDEALVRLKSWLETNRQWSVRVYETKAGLRYLFTHRAFDPTESASIRVLESLGADPLYITLCKNQKCYRARLSPKPWRCEYASPAVRFPFADEQSRANFNEWLTGYEQTAARYATCHFLETLGSGSVDLALSPLIELHDRHTRANEQLPLA
ncbi:MAG: hypothetical protein KDD69_02625 [Bdellovibrionales bacterium]|nr:hypothetical protein [Bdellovibrionales bacterium]